MSWLQKISRLTVPPSLSTSFWSGRSMATIRPPRIRRGSVGWVYTHPTVHVLRRNLMGKLDLAPGSSRLENSELELKGRQTPAPVVRRRVPADYCFIELVDHHVAAVHASRDLDLALALVVVDQESGRRLAHVAVLAADDGEAIEGVKTLGRPAARSV